VGAFLVRRQIYSIQGSANGLSRSNLCESGNLHRDKRPVVSNPVRGKPRSAPGGGL
jgi:hypothetical protein